MIHDRELIRIQLFVALRRIGHILASKFSSPLNLLNGGKTMNRCRLLISFLIFLIFSKATDVVAQTVVVDERTSRFEIVRDGGDLRLAVVNSTSKNIPIHVELSYLSVSDEVIKSLALDNLLRPGRNELHF